MRTAYYTFEQHFAHNTGDDHPEHAMRLLAIEQGLKQSGLWQELDIIQGSMAHTPDILRAHSHGYYDQLQLIQPEQGHIYVDEDTPMAPGSLEDFDKAVEGGAVAAAQLLLECCSPEVAKRMIDLVSAIGRETSG